MSTFNRKVRQILIKSGVVEEAALDQAIANAESTKSSLSEMLSKGGLIDQKRLLGLLAKEIGCPPLDVSRLSPDMDLQEKFPQELAEKYGICPISRIGSSLTIAMPDPFDIVKIDQLRLETRCEIRPVIALEHSVKDLVHRLYGASGPQMDELLEGMDEEEVELRENKNDENSLDLTDSGGAPAVKLVNGIIYQAIRDRASDIHIEPFDKTIKVRFRQDGLLNEVLQPPKNLQAAIISRIKIMAGLDIAERRKPQDGKFQVKVEGRQVDFRVSILPVIHGEKAVLRLLDATNLGLSLDSLGFEEKCLSDYRNAINAPYGMILITGPTGSGKSTTLYSALREIATPDTNVVTVEDPVEYQMEGINQVPVNPKRELTFAAALRSILRQDPDIILLGEIRDRETIEIAVKAALTGHLVLSTLHTNDAASTVTRMVDMGLDPFLVSSSVLLICAQRLLRKLCEHCKVPQDDMPPERLLALGFKPAELPGLTLFKAGPGCSRCANGFKGRFAALESLPMTDAQRRLIIEGKSSLDIKAQGLKEEMITLRRAAILNAGRGKTSLEEAVRATLSD